jgi:hypothetical protein
MKPLMPKDSDLDEAMKDFAERSLRRAWANGFATGMRTAEASHG